MLKIQDLDCPVLKLLDLASKMLYQIQDQIAIDRVNVASIYFFHNNLTQRMNKFRLTVFHLIKTLLS